VACSSSGESEVFVGVEIRLEAGDEVPESRPASSKMRLSMSMEEAAGGCGSGDGAITSLEVIF
jgi:hypothetical protein